MNEKDFLCTKGLARRWHIAHRTLVNWRSKGMGPAYFKIRGRVFYRKLDIEAFEARALFSTQEQVQRSLGKHVYHQQEVRS